MKKKNRNLHDRMGKAIKKPAKDTIMSFAAS